MQPSVAQARADTLREWASQYERDAMVGTPEGYTEAAFMCQRAARAIERASGFKAPEPPEPPPAAPSVDSVRNDEDDVD